LANFGSVGDRILQALPEMARDFYTVSARLQIAGQRHGCASLTPWNVDDSPTPGNYDAETGLAGWGARLGML
jgi:hypothetical protein